MCVAISYLTVAQDSELLFCRVLPLKLLFRRQDLYTDLNEIYKIGS